MNFLLLNIINCRANIHIIEIKLSRNLQLFLDCVFLQSRNTCIKINILDWKLLFFFRNTFLTLPEKLLCTNLNFKSWILWCNQHFLACLLRHYYQFVSFKKGKPGRLLQCFCTIISFLKCGQILCILCILVVFNVYV